MYTGNPDVPDDVFSDVLKQISVFVRTKVMPRELEIMATDAIPADLRAQAAEMGLFGYAIPQEWGGLGLDLVQDVEVAMELGYTSLALRSMFGTNNGIAGQVLVGFGTDEQKARWLPGIASGDVVASFALTEPGAGSNPAGLKTTAKPDGDGWIINGSKQFITNATEAGLFVVFARTAPATDTSTGIAVFLVPADAAGIACRQPRTPRWAKKVPAPPTSRSPTCASDREALVGGDGDIGYRAAMTSLARGRIHIAALAVGSAQRALDESVAYAATATQGGTPIGNFQLVQAMIADQQTGVLAGRALAREAARLYVTGEDRRIAPSAAKLFCTEMAGKDSRFGRPGARRRRLHARGGRRADLPRRPTDAPVRGHQRDPAPDHRRRTGPAGAAERVMTPSSRRGHGRRHRAGGRRTARHPQPRRPRGPRHQGRAHRRR